MVIDGSLGFVVVACGKSTDLPGLGGGIPQKGAPGSQEQNSRALLRPTIRNFVFWGGRNSAQERKAKFRPGSPGVMTPQVKLFPPGGRGCCSRPPGEGPVRPPSGPNSACFFGYDESRTGFRGASRNFKFYSVNASKWAIAAGVMKNSAISWITWPWAACIIFTAGLTLRPPRGFSINRPCLRISSLASIKWL